jgi:hypothetical protein
LYPQYDMQKAFQTGLNNMHRNLQKIKLNRKNTFTVWLLTERWDCSYFKQMYESPEKFGANGYQVAPTDEKEAVAVSKNGEPKHFIFAGRQLVSNDGLEILSLACDLFVKDRTCSTKELIDRVNAAGGIPVLNWAPGKWFFNRGKIVQQLLDTPDQTTFVVGDSPLRFTLWPQPKLMKDAVNKGFKLIAGSDPLPFQGEEKYIGTYTFSTDGEFDPAKPVTSVRQILKSKGISTKLIGKRNGPITFFYRETRIMTRK